jgi:hypothetical protein
MLFVRDCVGRQIDRRGDHASGERHLYRPSFCVNGCDAEAENERHCRHMFHISSPLIVEWKDFPSRRRYTQTHYPSMPERSFRDKSAVTSERIDYQGDIC